MYDFSFIVVMQTLDTKVEKLSIYSYGLSVYSINYLYHVSISIMIYLLYLSSIHLLFIYQYKEPHRGLLRNITLQRLYIVAIIQND